ncbi:MAG: NAD(P)/FAD-dependent oxidoreductase [Myxococcales bacterium]|nr:NAD(P)/FAD-dependent oxidoreductase [Myxococcales bacterium]
MQDRARPGAEFDVIVVGAGPGGATTAYYLAKGAADGTPRVALLEKEHFPRDKFCGDAWCAPALDILEDMGVLQELEAEGLVRDTRAGGFISPAGECCVSSGQATGAPGTRVYAIKRMICDERIARAAQKAGAELIEGANVTAAELGEDGFWRVRTGDGALFRSRALVAADGAPSKLARRLGVVNEAPTGFAARQYIKGGTHNFRADGVLFYPTYILPGYVALFRHYNDDIDLGSYVIPGGAAIGKDLPRIYEERIRRDPLIRAVLGPRVEYLEPLRMAPLRLGGVERSYARQLLVVGDAAGQTDPLTGEGIHTAMMAGRIAAETLREMLRSGDLSERACARYHERCRRAFGREFPASAMAARLTYRVPAMLDAASVVAQRRGDAFMEEFGAAMTGVAPKTTFLKPSVALPLTAALVGQLLRGAGRTEERYRRCLDADPSRETSFRNACLKDPAFAGAALR